MDSWNQTEITLLAKRRGCHLVTSEIDRQLSMLSDYRIGLCHLFLLHTSASLTINENADPDVRHDLNKHLDYLAPENQPYYRHTLEGPDDMPAHIKSSLMGAQLVIPIANGRLRLGTWQGIYLNEHRDYADARRLIATCFGQLYAGE